MSNIRAASEKAGRVAVSDVITGNDIRIGSGFKAQGFRYAEVGEIMDPLIMIDHFTMTESTFGAHGHAGISAVSILLEDSVGAFHNRDSIGNDIDLLPGDIFWLKAGRGAVHDEKPRAGSKAHGLQIFVNLPANQKYDSPESLLVRAADVPRIEKAGICVRVLLGQSGGVVGASAPSVPLTILDGKLKPRKAFEHVVEAGNHVWVQIISGTVTVNINGLPAQIYEGQAIAISALKDAARLELSSESGTQFVLIDGRPISEPIVQRGPFAMSTEADVDAVERSYQRGEFGTIS